MLINIHGQHDNQILMDSDRHLQILDDFGGDNSLLEEYRQTFRELQQTARRLGELKKREKESAFRQRELNEIIDDIGEIELSAGEDEQLEKEYSAAKNAENIIIAVKNAVSAIIGEDAANDMLVTAETEIAGYTDSMRDTLAAQRMSLDMAQRVGVFLSRKEIKPVRMFIVGRGSARPIAAQDSIGRLTNRRVEIRIAPAR
jgi:DNA repair protein RecN (Recombination protein N)